MKVTELDDTDRELIARAEKVLAQNYNAERHSVGAAVLCGSGKIYSAINVESVGYGPCAEPIAVGSAISNGERELQRIVAVNIQPHPDNVVSPCGNCRQLLYDYAPECLVIINRAGKLVKIAVRDLLPDAYDRF